jgi:hypothetical protein
LLWRLNFYHKHISKEKSLGRNCVVSIDIDNGPFKF